MSQNPNQLRSYAAVVTGSPPTPTSVITPTLTVAGLPGGKGGLVRTSQGEYTAKCIWVCRFASPSFHVTMTDNQHDDRTRSCLCRITRPLEADQRSVEDKEIKEEGKAEDGQQGKKDKKEDTKEYKEENVKETEDVDEGLKTPPTSRWSKTPAQLALEASRIAAKPQVIPGRGMPESRFAKRRREEQERDQPRRQLIREWDLDFAQACIDVEKVGELNRASYQLHCFGGLAR